jgi:hypothetical protein
LERFMPAPLMYTPPYVGQSTFSSRVKSHLKKAIVTSKRRGAWFSLDRREKSIVYLSLKLNVRFESLELLRALASILKKLQQQGETVYAWLRRGTELAWAFSEYAVSCGNETARAWRNDRGYALYLGRILTKTGGSYK